MRKLSILFFAVVGVMMAAMPVLAQAPAVQAVDNNAGPEGDRRGRWLCDRGVWWRAWPIAHRRGSLRRRGA